MSSINLLVLWFIVLTFGGKTNSEHVINAYDNTFNIYWNVPTFQCRGKKVFFEELHAKYGIIANTNDSFKGDRMVIMYDPGNFPAILTDSESGITVLRNGGVPQAGNLRKHLQMFKATVNNDFPNIHYNSLAVIDFESWRPIYRQNSGLLLWYKVLSVKIERERHPYWSQAQVKKEAERRFEKEGRKFVVETLKLAKYLRPNATWGYYAYPYCYNMQSPDYLLTCSETVSNENNRLHWMYEASQSLHPLLYFPETLTPPQRRALMAGRIHEAVRIKNQFAGHKSIYPYFWFVYRDTKRFMSPDDWFTAIALFKNYGTDGMVIWGSTSDVNTKEKCQKLYSYVDEVLGPVLLQSKLSYGYL